MKSTIGYGCLGMLLVLFIVPALSEQRIIVHLTVIHDGRKCPGPDRIKLSLRGHSATIPVRDGVFLVPPQFANADSVMVETDIEGDHIRVSQLPTVVFEYEQWILRMAERVDGDYYEWSGPTRADIPTTCILECESIHHDPGIEYFKLHCRSKNK